MSLDVVESKPLHDFLNDTDDDSDDKQDGSSLSSAAIAGISLSSLVLMFISPPSTPRAIIVC